MKIRIAGIVKESITDGKGFRYVVFTQGCPHGCPGCHNPQTQGDDGGYWADTDELLEEFRQNPLLKGITFSGGEPFQQPRPLIALAQQVHALGKDVTTFTGWTYEQLLAMKDPDIHGLLAETDVLVDGPFIEAQKNLELFYRGSENQQLIDMKKTRAAGEIVLLALDRPEVFRHQTE